jgi:hypothetical protein
MTHTYNASLSRLDTEARILRAKYLRSFFTGWKR